MRVFVQQRYGRYDHAVEAITTLRRLLLYKRFLHRVQRIMGACKTFQGSDEAAFYRLYRQHTTWLCFSIQ